MFIKSFMYYIYRIALNMERVRIFRKHDRSSSSTTETNNSKAFIQSRASTILFLISDHRDDEKLVNYVSKIKYDSF